jgi:hypothetical protein
MKFEGARARNFVEQKKIVPILVFFGSQEAVKKIWSQKWEKTLFWHFLTPSGTHLGSSRQLLTLFFQLFQSRRLVWNNKIEIFSMG